METDKQKKGKRAAYRLGPSYYTIILQNVDSWDTKGTFHAKMGTIKDRNDMDLTEAEGIKKRWQEYTEELYKKILMTQITMTVWSFT